MKRPFVTFVMRRGLADNPALADELGNLNVAWAALEFKIFRLFEVLTQLPIPLARAIYYSQRTTAARIELVQAVIPIVLRRRKRGRGIIKFYTELGDPLVLQQKISTLLGQIGNLAGDRNKFVHDPWAGHKGSSRAYQMRLKGKDLHGKYERARIGDIRRLVLKIETKADALYRLYDRLAPMMPPLLDILGLQHELTLVPAKKSTPPKSKKAKPQHRPRSSQG